MRSRSTGLLLVALSLLLAGCDAMPVLPSNPFRSTPTVEPPTPSPVPIVLVTSTPTPPPFRAFWVKNHRLTEMWSAPDTQQGAVSFGTTSHQFCYFQVVEPQVGGRLYVLNPYTQNFLWIDADSVGPVGEEPPRDPGPKPPDRNCAEAIYEG